MLKMNETTVKALEAEELEAGPEDFRVEGYVELLAAYLLQDELCNAKFLWKRIPQSQKTNAELAAVWNVGQQLWLRDLPGFYSAVQAHQWTTPNISLIMEQLTAFVREKVTRLIGMSYTSIKIQDVATLLGLSNSEAETVALSKEWEISEGLVLPKDPPPQEVQLITAEEQICQLTDYVTFLEN